MTVIVIIIITIIKIIIIIINKIMYHKNGWNENNHVSVQHINHYKLSEVAASIVKYTSILIVNCLQELINNMLNLQTTYPIATHKSSQNFYNGHRKTKIETIPGNKYSY